MQGIWELKATVLFLHTLILLQDRWWIKMEWTTTLATIYFSIACSCLENLINSYPGAISLSISARSYGRFQIHDCRWSRRQAKLGKRKSLLTRSFTNFPNGCNDLPHNNHFEKRMESNTSVEFTIYCENNFINFTTTFLQEHFNFYAVDEAIGPVVMSTKTEQISGQEHTRVLLR